MAPFVTTIQNQKYQSFGIRNIDNERQLKQQHDTEALTKFRAAWLGEGVNLERI
jgi:hypothetical protein